MGAIKDIVDLCIKLRDENKDGKVARALSEIQSLTLALQSDQAAFAEKNAELVTENLELKRKIFDLESVHRKEIAALQERHREEIAKITPNSGPSTNILIDSKDREILKWLFDTGQKVTVSEIAQHFQMTTGKAEYHKDKLFELRLIDRPGITLSGAAQGETRYYLTAAGRKFVVEIILPG